MSIWHGTPDLASSKKLEQGTIHDALGITVTEIGDNYVRQYCFSRIFRFYS